MKQNILIFSDTNRSSNSAQTTRPIDSQQKKKKKKKKEKEKEKEMRICWIVDFVVLADHRVKIKEIEKRYKYLELARELKKQATMEREGDGDVYCNLCTRNNYQNIDKRTRRHRNPRTSTEHPDYSIIKIGVNTEKSSGELRRLAVSQTPVKNHHLTLVWKKHK